MMSINEILDGLDINREQYTRLSMKAQEGRPIDDIYRMETSIEVDDRKAFQTALTIADAKGWLRKFLMFVFKEGLEHGTIGDYLTNAPQDADRQSELQAIKNYAAGFANPSVAIKGMTNASKWTCKVYVNNQASGSGVLVGPNLVLTAWHVLEPYFTKGASGYAAKAEAIGLYAEFNNIYDFVDGEYIGRHTKKIPAHKAWSVGWCACHTDELLDKNPARLEELEGCWDYAIFRIEKPIGTELNWAIPDKAQPVPNIKEKVTVFQHPAQQPMRFDNDVIVALNPPNPMIVPGFRFLHDANTTFGSSGGPVFNKQFNLFGVHQGVWSKSEDNVTNKGIPLSKILDHMEANFGLLPPPDASEVKLFMITKSDGMVEPLIGCDRFQEILWGSLVNGRKRLIIIEGETGMGKSVRIRLLDEIVKDATNFKLKFSAATISKMKVLDFIDHISPYTGLKSPSLTPLSQFNSTISAWLKNEVALKVVQALNAGRENKKVWIILTDLDLHQIEGENLKEFLMLLNEYLVTTDWLRVVWSGSRDNVPQILAEVTERHVAEKFTREDVKTFLIRFLASRNIDENPESIVRSPYRMYEQDHSTMREISKARLVQELVNVIEDFKTIDQ
jgi:hypothetical protein